MDWLYLPHQSLAAQTQEGHIDKGMPAQNKYEDATRGGDTVFHIWTEFKSFKHQESLTPCTWTHAFWPLGVDPKMRMMGTWSMALPSSSL